MEILKCTNIKKVFGKGDNQLVALDGINLSVNKGEFVAITGASGSGKSTLLHIIGGVDKPTEGTVIVDGMEVEKLNATKSAIYRRKNVGLVYQFYNLLPTLTVEKNILMPMLLDKKQPDKNHFDEMINILGLNDKMNSLPHQLSGGQQQRVAIARALLYKPAVLLADEPTGNLDKKNSAEVMALLKESNKRLNQTIILITHDENIAMSADRIIKIEDGKIVSDQKRGIE